MAYLFYMAIKVNVGHVFTALLQHFLILFVDIDIPTSNVEIIQT